MTFLLLIIPTMILGFWAQSRVQSTYGKFSRIGSRSRITGREAADAIIRKAGINDVEIVSVPGQLTDHYDPSRKRLALSEPNYNGTSLAALGVAAHESGHAIQHHQAYAPLKARMALVPVVGIANNLLMFVMFGGFFFFGPTMIYLGVIGYGALTVFNLITLPVEFDASRRAKLELAQLGIIDQDELPGVTKTLDAAGWTYVAAFASSLAWLLHFLLMAQNRD